MFAIPSLPLRPLSLAIACICGGMAQAAELSYLDMLSGGSYAGAHAVSSNGQVVVGEAKDGAAGNGSRAVLWTRNGVRSLGALAGDDYSAALAVSGDGRTAVGISVIELVPFAPLGRVAEAFIWTESGGMRGLGTLNGGRGSEATGVSADGRIVVGTSADGSVGGDLRAFRWTASDGMQSLGTLNGGFRSEAQGISADGRVIVGDATDGADFDYNRAFRWTQLDGIQSLGALNGGLFSSARAVSADGSVVVGYSADGAARDEFRAFRWTATDGMQSLGTLNGGSESLAYGVSGDGRVVVGSSRDGADGDAVHATRWSAASGLQTVADWLRDNGVSVAVDDLEVAKGTNADGSVVVGDTQDGRAFIARISEWGSGMVELDDLQQSLYASQSLSALSLASAELALHGAHSRPLARRVEPGRSCLWLAGDWASDDHGRRDGSASLAELGGCLALSPSLQLSLGYGRTFSQQRLSEDGRASLRGDYLFAELLGEVAPTLWATFGGFYQWGELDSRRGYRNAGNRDSSRGDSDSRTWGLRARLDWQAGEWSGFDLKPFVELSHLQTRLDGYREQGGGFPVRFDGRRENASDLRLGSEAGYRFNASTRLFATLEGVHRFQHSAARSSGTVLGLFDFDLAGESGPRDWLHASLGVEQRLGAGTLSAALHGTSHGQEADAWLAANYQWTF